MLEVVDIYKRFGAKHAVAGVSLRVDDGEIVGLLGPNGAGKTTTFNLIAGLERADAGRIELDQADVTSWPMHKRALAGVGYLPQEPSIFRRLSVEDNLRLVLEMRGVAAQEIDRLIDGALRSFGIEALRLQGASTLSGGERRRVEVARAVVLRPRVLLLDEPFTGIDPIATADLQQLIAWLKTQGLGILVTDHNVRETLAVVDRAYIIHQGKVLVSGPAAMVARHADARRFFFGEHFEYISTGLVPRSE